MKLSDAEVKKQFAKIKATQFPKAAEFEKFLASSGQTVSDLLLRVKLNLLSQKIQKKIIKNKSQRHPSADHEVLQRKQVAVRHARKAQREDHPRPRPKRRRTPQSRKSNRARASRAWRPKSRSTRPARPNGGLLKEVVKGEEEKALDTAIFSAQQGPDQRACQDPVRLLHLSSRDDHAGHAGSAVPGPGVDQSAADRHGAAGSAEQVREGIQKEVDGQNGMPLGLRGPRLQAVQSAEDRRATATGSVRT